MLIVLVTGSMGSGKSSAMALLEAKPYPVFKADDQVRELLKPESPCYHRLKPLFGEACFSGAKGEGDRKKLAQEIFSHPAKRKAVEAIIHPLVQESFKKFIEDQKKQSPNKPVFYEAPLISDDIFDSFDKRVLLMCPKDIQKRRLIRKGWTDKEIEERWAVQIPESEIIDKMDFVIDNSGDLKSLNIKVNKMLCSLTAK